MRADRRRVLVVERTGQGGVHQYSHGLAAALAARGDEVTLLTTIEREQVPHPAGGRFRKVRLLHWSAAGGRWSALIRELVNLALVVAVALQTRSRVVVIQLVHPGIIDPWAVPLLRKLGRRVILTCHNLGWHERDGIIESHGLRTYRAADEVVTLSDAERRKLLAAAPELDAVTATIPHGNFRFLVGERPDQEAARDHLALRADEPVLLFFGFFKAYKGIDLLLDAAALLRDRGRAVRCVLAGAADDATAAAIEAQLDRLALRELVQVRRGYVEPLDADRYFAAADAVVLPYREATQSGVVQLAYAHARPVVVTDVGGLAEDVTEGDSGEVAAPDDPAALADAVDRLVGDRARLAARQARLAESPPPRSEWPAIAAAYHDVFDRPVHGAGPVVVFVSNVQWEGTWYGAQHLASRLSERGFRVLFLDLPVSVASPLRDRRRARQFRSRLRRLSPTLAVDTPIGLPPQEQRQMRAVNARIFARRVRRVLRRLGWPEPALVVGRYTYSARLADLLPTAAFVANLSDASWWEEPQERARRLSRAVAAFCVSPVLVDEAVAAGLSEVLLLPQGVDCDAIVGSASAGCAPALAGIGRPRIGCLGNITPRTDFTLVEQLARARPEWQFVFVGGAGPRFEALADLPVDHLPNVHSLPPCDRTEVGAHIAGFDVAWVPYTWSEFNVASNPLKVWEYLAVGVPVVAPAFPALAPMAGVATLVPDSAGPEDWLSALEGALEERDELSAARRRAFAGDNTWDDRADDLAAFLHETLAGAQ